MNQDLKSRIPIAVLYVLSIAACTIGGLMPTTILLLLFLVFCLTEFVQNSNSTPPGNRIYIYGLSILLSILLIGFIHSSHLHLILASIICFFFVLNVFFIIRKKKTLFIRLPVIVSSVIYILLPFVLSIRMVQSTSSFPLILLGIFIILWLNDAGAYFVGKAFGRNKLFPQISPGKTWEGFLGGGIVGLIIAFLLTPVLGVLNTELWIFLAILIWISGVLGDLTESSWKRNMGIKDSGTLLKGHGGFLDRLDSFIYAIPFVVFFLLFQL